MMMTNDKLRKSIRALLAILYAGVAADVAIALPARPGTSPAEAHEEDPCAEMSCAITVTGSGHATCCCHPEADGTTVAENVIRSCPEAPGSEVPAGSSLTKQNPHVCNAVRVHRSRHRLSRITHRSDLRPPIARPLDKVPI